MVLDTAHKWKDALLDMIKQVDDSATRIVVWGEFPGEMAVSSTIEKKKAKR
jgi:hypothetical protein